MSDTANVQLIKSLYEAMGQSTVEAALAFLSNDVEFVVPGPVSVGAAGSDIIHFFTVRDGKVVRLVDFFDTLALADAHRL